MNLIDQWSVSLQPDHYFRLSLKSFFYGERSFEVIHKNNCLTQFTFCLGGHFALKEVLKKVESVTLNEMQSTFISNNCDREYRAISETLNAGTFSAFITRFVLACLGFQSIKDSLDKAFRERCEVDGVAARKVETIARVRIKEGINSASYSAALNLLSITSKTDPSGLWQTTRPFEAAPELPYVHRELLNFYLDEESWEEDAKKSLTHKSFSIDQPDEIKTWISWGDLKIKADSFQMRKIAQFSLAMMDLLKGSLEEEMEVQKNKTPTPDRFSSTDYLVSQESYLYKALFTPLFFYHNLKKAAKGNHKKEEEFYKAGSEMNGYREAHNAYCEHLHRIFPGLQTDRDQRYAGWLKSDLLGEDFECYPDQVPT